MEPNLVVIALALGALVGASLGLLGGGGSILTVPILTYVLGLAPREAIAASLFIVGVTSAVSLIGHARAGRVRWKSGALFGVAGMLGAFAGGILGGFIPGVVLMILFAFTMIITATATIRGRRDRAASTPDSDHSRHFLRILIDGLLVGAATGLVGAGGGFLIVPALNLLGGLPMALTVGTSLLVIAMKSFAGLGGYLFSVQLDWPILLAFTTTAIAGSFAGVALAGRIPERILRKGLGVFVLVMGGVVLSHEAPALVASFTTA